MPHSKIPAFAHLDPSLRLEEAGGEERRQTRPEPADVRSQLVGDEQIGTASKANKAEV